MARVKIVGRDWINVPQSVADKVSEAKSSGNYKPDHIIDLGYNGQVELGQIKQVIPDDPNALKEADNFKIKAEQRERESNEFDAMVGAYRMQTPIDKALRVARTWAQLLWTIRGNWTPENKRIPEELVEKIAKRLIPFFEENVLEWTCGKELYQDLIPYGEAKASRSNIKGVVTIGQAIQGVGIIK